MKIESKKKQEELKTVRKNKWFKIEGQKVLTPEKMVVFKDVNGESNYHVYGDSRCSNCGISGEMIQEAQEKQNVLIVLRVPKSKDGDSMIFNRPIADLLYLRKRRLANCINLSVINEIEGEEVETPESFMIEELGGCELRGKELEQEFLTSLNKDLVLKDIKRLIDYYYKQDGRTTKNTSIKAVRNN